MVRARAAGAKAARAARARIATARLARVRAARATKADRAAQDGLRQGGNQPTRHLMKGFFGFRRFANVGISDPIVNRGGPERGDS